MIFFDGIIHSLQGNGGISVLFREICKEFDSKSFKYFLYKNLTEGFKSEFFLKPRVLERYRDCDIDLSERDIFHSTYYTRRFTWIRFQL